MALPFFSNSCDWRKCAFCNIGKLEMPNRLSLDQKIAQVEKYILWLRENKIDSLAILDPSISFSDLLLVARVFQKHHFSLPVHVRTRYDEGYKDKKNCELLAQAGISYLGM